MLAVLCEEKNDMAISWCLVAIAFRRTTPQALPGSDSIPGPLDSSIPFTSLDAYKPAWPSRGRYVSVLGERSRLKVSLCFLIQSAFGAKIRPLFVSYSLLLPQCFIMICSSYSWIWRTAAYATFEYLFSHPLVIALFYGFRIPLVFDS